jgi:hypothetical protein
VPPFLTDDEIAGICEGLSLPGAQCRHLARLGLLVNRKPNGRPAGGAQRVRARARRRPIRQGAE